MKKIDVINLIKYYSEKNDYAFRNEAYKIANDFDISGDTQLAEYIMALLSDANTFVPQSFDNPTDTEQNNSQGTNNLLEAMRIKDCDARMVFAGSSEEYGLVISSKDQYNAALKQYGSIFPDIKEGITHELPISETNPLRPMSPYAVSKVSASCNR